MNTFFVLQAFFAVFLWAASRIILKQSLIYLSPYLLAGLVQLVAFLFLLISFLLRRGRPALPRDPLVLSSLVLISLIGFAGAPLFSIIGLQYAPGVLAGLLAGLNAVLVIILAGIVLGEIPKGSQLVGIAVAIAGSFLFITNLPESGMLFGTLLLLLAEIGFALTTVLMRSIIIRHRLSPYLISLVGSGIGTAVLLPIGILSSSLPQFSWILLLAVLVLGLIFAFASAFWYDALQYLRAFEISIIASTILPQIALLSLLFLGEKMGFQEVVGSVLVVLGAIVVELKPPLVFLQTLRAKS